MERLATLSRHNGIALRGVSPLAFPARLPLSRRARLQSTICAAAEAPVAEPQQGPANDTQPVAIAEKPAQSQDDKPKKSRQPREKRNDRSPAKARRSGGDAQFRGRQKPPPPTSDRAIIHERTQLLLRGEAVGISMAPTSGALAVGFKGLRPLSQELKRKSHTLLFFPSLQQAADEAAAPSAAEQSAVQDAPGPEGGATAPSESQGKAKGEAKGRGRGNKEALGRDGGGRKAAAGPASIDLALVAVPQFQAPTPEITIRVGAKSDVGTISRTLTRALLGSSAVAVHAAGPSAALVAVRAAVQARRALGQQEQIDLAFSIEYLRVPANEASKPSSEGLEVAATTTTTITPAATTTTTADAPAPAAAATSDSPASSEAAANSANDTSAAPADAVSTSAAVATSPAGEQVAKAEAAQPALASILQFSFYKRALPIPEVLVSDFAPTRDGAALTQLVVGLMGQRREMELVLDSRDALFAAQSVARAVRECWSRYSASVGLFLTSLEPTPGDDVALFTARLQLRRIPGAPNLVAASGFGSSRQSLLGTPLGTVKWNTPVEGLAAAISREMESAGVFSILPEEGICVARTLRALWEAQTKRTAAAAAAAAGTSADAATAAASPVVQIAIVPEIQSASPGVAGDLPPKSRRERGEYVKDPAGRAGAEGRAPGSPAPGPGSGLAPRATVLHLVEVTPVLASTLRLKDGAVMGMKDREQLLQVVKAVVLRNRMYGNRAGGKTLVMRPTLDRTGLLSVKFEYIPTAQLGAVPEPPAPRAEAAAAATAAATANSSVAAKLLTTDTDDTYTSGYNTDDEFGVGAEAAVLVAPPGAAAAVAAAKAAAAASAPAAAEGGSSGKSAWILYVNSSSRSRALAMDIVAETIKPYDRLSPAWLRVLCQPKPLATAALAVAQAQPQVQEDADVQLLILPVLDRKRDERNRPFNGLTLRLLKSGPGAEPGAALAAARRREAVGRVVEDNKEADGAGGKGGKRQRSGPSPNAMAAAAAAAAKLVQQDNALMAGTRKMW